MKKRISIIITVLILSLCFLVTAFATEENRTSENSHKVTFSEDFTKMQFDNYTYSRVDSTKLYTDYYFDYEFEEFDEYSDVFAGYTESIPSNGLAPISPYIELTDTQSVIVDEIDIYGDEVLSMVTVYYKDGATLSISFLRDDYLDDYNKIISGDSEYYKIDFMWPDGNTVKAESVKFTNGEKEKISSASYYVDTTFTVYAISDDGKLTAEIGEIILYNKEYYYFNHLELISQNDDASIYDIIEVNSTIDAYKITDEHLITQIKEAETKYYEDDLGFFYDEELAETISIGFLTILFAIAPFIVAVTSLIFAIKSKKEYRKLLASVTALSVIEIIIFIVFVVVVKI